MKYRLFLPTILLLLSAHLVFSQTAELKNAVFLELGGNAYYYSINYERKSGKALIGRIGVAFFNDTFVIPLAVGKLFGKKQHHFEIAGGVDLAKKTTTNNIVRASESFIAITAFAGYRYQKPESQFFLKAGFTPLWQVYESNYDVDLATSTFYPWAGIGFGFRF